jgi:hypothetical protein
MESTNNKTFVPINAGQLYIGNPDNISNFSNCIITIVSDTNCLVTMYQSDNPRTGLSANDISSFTDANPTEYPTRALVPYVRTIDLTKSYVYFTLQVLGQKEQNYLNFTVLYNARDQGIIGRVNTKVWDDIRITNNTQSSTLDMSHITPHNLSVFGTTTESGSITIMFSYDNLMFYNTQYFCNVSDNQNFGFTITCAAPFAKLNWTGNDTIITAIMSVS